ncbi:MAG TPA: hypothetical protein VFN97_01655 [Actinospica sp.]|nr:hypothetical protein [Actinospica sp.]
MTFTVRRVVSREGLGFACERAYLSVGRDGRVYLLSTAIHERGATMYLLRTNVDGSGREGIQYPINTDGSGAGEGFTYATGNADGYAAIADVGAPPEVWLFSPALGIDPLARVAGPLIGGMVPYRVEAGGLSKRFYALAQYGLKNADGTVTQNAQIAVIGDPALEPLTGLPAIPLPFGHDATIQVLDFRVRETGSPTAPAPVFYVLYHTLDSDGKTFTNHLAEVDQTGTLLWTRTDDASTGKAIGSIARQLGGEQMVDPDTGGIAGGFDVDDSGHVYVLAPRGTAIYRLPGDGTGAATALALPADAPSASNAPYRELRIVGGNALLQRSQNRELYGVFTLPDPASSGSISFERSVLSRHDVAQADFDAEPDPAGAPWTAGGSVTATLTLTRYGASDDDPMPAPKWTAWVRSIGGQDHRELAVAQAPAAGTGATTVQIAVPADLGGLFQLTIAPHTSPWRTGVVDEYRLRRVIEVCPPDAAGSVSISTVASYHGDFGNSLPLPDPRPFNRLRYAAGEPMVVSVSVRPAPTAARQVVLRLDDVSGPNPVTVARTTLSIPPDGTTPGVVTVTVPGSVTALLRPAGYLLTTTAASDITVAAQPIELGPGRIGSGFRRVLFGDLSTTFPAMASVFTGPYAADYLDGADTAAVFLERSRRLGWSMVVDRLADSPGQSGMSQVNPVYRDGRDPEVRISAIANRLALGGSAVDPAKIWALPPLLEIITGYGARGVELRSILLPNDSALPLPELDRTALAGNDPVSPRFDLLAQANRLLSGYRPFGGWHWAANWWPYENGPYGIEYNPPGFPESLDGYLKEYHDTLYRTKGDGVWRPLLAAWFAHAVEHIPAAARMLRKELLAVADAGAGRADLVAAYAGPATQAFLYPPDSFAEADEVDLQNQQEQYPMMLGSAFWLDYLRRPGKAAVLHQESYNDSGTGDQVLGQAFEALLRGADTSGHAAAGNLPDHQQIPWARQQDLLPDPRFLGAGLPGMFRVLSGVLHEYGEWVSRFDSADPVVILLSRRQFAVQRWGNTLPGHVGRVFEAYISLLYAHIPAALVFVEDLGSPGARPISDYAAVLLVNERVELDPKVLAALAAARQAGVPVFHDGTSPGDGDPAHSPEDGDGCLDTVVAGLGSTSLGVSFGLAYAKNPDGDYAFAQEKDDASVFSANATPAGVPVSWVGIAATQSQALLRGPLPDAVGLDTGTGTGTRYPTAGDSQVLISERRHGSARIVLAVNNSVFSTDADTIGVDNAIFRRADTWHSVRAPLPTTVTLPGLSSGAAVYDVLGGTTLTPAADGTVPIDLRHWPAAILAVLPSPITGVAVSAGPVVEVVAAPGPPQIDWSVTVIGGSEADASASGGGDVPLPVRVRILDDRQSVLWESHTQAPASGSFTVPVNAQGEIRVEAVELITGRFGSTSAGVAVGSGDGADTPLDLLTGPVAGGSAAASASAPVPAAATPRVSATPEPDWQPAAARLGAHLSAVALTSDGTSAVFTAANWDGNLYAVDLATGAPRWQARIGHQFSYLPRTLPQGVAVIGADLTTPSEFGLHLIDPGTGTVGRRFDLYGTTARWFDRTTTCLTDGRPPAFATAPDGSWIASAGNLGLAVWGGSGDLLWSQASWSQTSPTPHPGRASTAFLAALDDTRLLLVDDRIATAFDAASGKQLVQLDLSGALATVNGKATAAALSPDGASIAVATSHDGGRVVILDTTDLALQAVLTTRADELAWTTDGGLITAYDTRVSRYRRNDSAGSGWALDSVYPAGDVVHNIAVADDGRIACGDEQGDLIVLDSTLTPVFSADVGGLPVPRWLPGGDLLVGTWLGQVQRLNGDYQATWSTVARSTAPDMRRRFLAPTTASVSAVTDHGNGIAPLTGENLFPAAAAAVFLDPGVPGQGPLTLAVPNPVPDGYQPTPLKSPWLSDDVVEGLSAAAENAEAHAILIQFPPTTQNPQTPQSVTFDAISLWDDPAHPESWLRDLRLDVRDSPDRPWRPISRLISDQPARSYRVTDPDPASAGHPITATELRLLLPPGVPGNIRLAAVALHLTA